MSFIFIWISIYLIFFILQPYLATSLAVCPNCCILLSQMVLLRKAMNQDGAPSTIVELEAYIGSRFKKQCCGHNVHSRSAFIESSHGQSLTVLGVSVCLAPDRFVLRPDREKSEKCLVVMKAALESDGSLSSGCAQKLALRADFNGLVSICFIALVAQW